MPYNADERRDLLERLAKVPEPFKDSARGLLELLQDSDCSPEPLRPGMEKLIHLALRQIELTVLLETAAREQARTTENALLLEGLKLWREDPDALADLLDDNAE